MKTLLKKVCEWFRRERKPSCPHCRVFLEVEELGPRIVPTASTSWLGGTSDNWNIAANWNNGVPTNAMDAVISANLPPGASTPHILAGQTGVCATLTSGNNLLIDSTASLRITGQSANVGRANVNVWTGGTLTGNGVFEIDNQGTQQDGFQWSGGSIAGAQDGANNWGIYICNGALFRAVQSASQLGTSVNVGQDILYNTTQTVTSYFKLGGSPASGNALTGQVTLNGRAIIYVFQMGEMDLLNNTNLGTTGGIVMAGGAASQLNDITVNGKMKVVQPTDGSTLVIQPQTFIQSGAVLASASPNSKVNFAYNGPGESLVVQANGIFRMGNGDTYTTANGLLLQSGGALQVQGAAGLNQATFNGNILDNGQITLGDANGYAKLTVNGNVDIENGNLWVNIGFDNTGTLSQYSSLVVSQEFGVLKQAGSTPGLYVKTNLTNGVQPTGGQIIKIVQAGSTSTSDPTNVGFSNFTWDGYTYNNPLPTLTATDYRLTTRASSSTGGSSAAARRRSASPGGGMFTGGGTLTLKGSAHP